MRWFVVPVLICALAWAAAALPRAEAAHPTGNTYAIDLDPATSGIQSALSVQVGSTFTFDTVITAVPDPYGAYQVNIHYDANVLNYASGPVEFPLSNVNICAGGKRDETAGVGILFDGCAGAGGNQTDNGVTFEWTLKCVADGVTTLHFRTDAEEGVATGTNFAIDAPDNEGVGDPVLQDAKVTCGNGTPGPVTPTSAATTPTPASTAIPTPNPTQIEEAKTPGSPAQATVTAFAAAVAAGSVGNPNQRTATSLIADATGVALAKTPGSAAAVTATARALVARSGGGSNGSASTAQDAKRTDSGGSSHTGLIVGIIVAVVAVAGAGAGGLMFWRRRSGAL